MPTPADHLLRCIRRIACQSSSEADDSVLLKRFLMHRDSTAFEMLVARHGPMVLRVCQNVLGNRHDAEDAFQATFLILAKKAGSIQPPGRLAGWLHGVAYRVALGARTASRRRRNREDLVPDLVSLDPCLDPLAQLTAREALRILEEEVQRLPEAYRLPVVLCCLHGVSQEEAARQLGWTPGSVKGRLERGRKRLQRRLAARGLELAAALALVEVSRTMAASLGEEFVVSTARAAVAEASGNNAGSCLVSARVKALAGVGLRPVSLVNVKLGILLLLVAGSGTAGLATWGFPLLAGKAPEVEQLKPREDNEQARTTPNSDPLPAGAVARIGSTRLRQGGSVSGLAFSPDGKVVASCGGDSFGEDRAIHLWDVATGKETASFRGDKGLDHLSFSPDGKLLASAGWGSPVRLWDAATGKERCQCKDKGEVVRDLAFSPDGKLLAGVVMGAWKGHVISLWDTATGQVVRSWKGEELDMWSAAFSPDGTVLATAGPENVLYIWDVATGTEKRRIEVDKVKSFGRPLAFSPDAKVLALANEDAVIQLCEPATGRELTPLRGHKGQILRLAFGEGGRTLISSSKDGTIRFWDMATSREKHSSTMQGGIGDCRVMAFSPEGKTLGIGGERNTIRLFDSATGKSLQAPDAHVGPIELVRISGQGDIVTSVNWDRVVSSVEVRTGKERHRSDRRPSYLLSMVLSQEYGNRMLIYPAALSDDNRLIAVPGNSRGNETTVRIWEVASGREVGSFTGNLASVLRLVFSPDQKSLALTCSDHTIRVWDIADRKEVHRLPGHQGDIFAVGFSPDGKLLASGSTDQTARLWDLATGKELFQLRQQSAVHAVAFSPDGRSFATAGGRQYGEESGDTSVTLWELASGQKRSRLSGDHHLVSCLAFAPGGKFLALGSSDGTVRVWDPIGGKELRRFAGHRGIVKSVAFSSDGKRLVSGSTDTTVLIWDTSDLVSLHAPEVVLTAAERETLWGDLADDDAGHAWRAMRSLRADSKEIVSFLRERLKPAPPIDSLRIERWVADLDADGFAAREKAMAELTKLGEQAEPALRRALGALPSLESRHRAESLLAKLMPVTSPESLRALRALEVLEQLATPEARELLAALASGAAESRLTREARAALDRLNNKR